MYSDNDWRFYTLAHASKYDWSTGNNSPEYNHDYWEANKDRIIAQRRDHRAAVREFNGGGVGNKVRSADGRSYNNMDRDWGSEMTDDERSNIGSHNTQVEKNIAELTKTVNDYINANKDKLTSEQISKLKKDLQTQIEIANEQRISTRNSDDRDYVMGLRKNSAQNEEEILDKWGNDFGKQFREQYKQQGGQDEELANQVEQQFREQLNQQYQEQRRKARR